MILSPDFKLHRYGLDVRFVDLQDAEFILRLRTDPMKRRYIGKTDDTLDAQIHWIRNYKLRQGQGTDYYFMYSFHDRPAGVNRIYEIKDDHFIHGSWVFGNDVPPFCSLAAAIIAREIAFDSLGLEVEEDTSGIHENNINVLEVSRMLGVEFTGERKCEGGRFLTGRLTKDDFEKNKSNILRIIPQKYL